MNPQLVSAAVVAWLIGALWYSPVMFAKPWVKAHGYTPEQIAAMQVMQGKVIGCYLHGSCLPKNPWVADRLLGWALSRRYPQAKIEPLDDRDEAAARDQAIAVARTRT